MVAIILLLPTHLRRVLHCEWLQAPVWMQVVIKWCAAMIMVVLLIVLTILHPGVRRPLCIVSHPVLLDDQARHSQLVCGFVELTIPMCLLNMPVVSM